MIGSSYGMKSYEVKDLRSTPLYKHITFVNPGAQVWQFAESFPDSTEMVSLEKYLTLHIVDEEALDITKACLEKLLRAPDWIYGIHVENMVNVKHVRLKHESNEFPSENGVAFTKAVERDVTSISIPLGFPDDLPEVVLINFKRSGEKTLTAIPTMSSYDCSTNWTVELEPYDEVHHASANVKLSIGYLNPWWPNGERNLTRSRLCEVGEGVPRPKYFVNGKEFTATRSPLCEQEIVLETCESPRKSSFKRTCRMM